MKKNIMNKLVLSTALLLLGTTSTQLPKTPISFSSEAKAYNISENETNINELIKYYTQPHFSLSGKWLWQKPNGSIHATLKRGFGIVIFKYLVLKVGETLIS